MPNDDFALMRKSDYEVRLGEIKMNQPFIIRVKTLVNKVSIVLSVYYYTKWNVWRSNAIFILNKTLSKSKLKS